MNINSTKKVMAAMGGNPASTHQNLVPQRTSKSCATIPAEGSGESGAVFRSVSMAMNAPPKLFARSQTSTVHKAYSMPYTKTSKNSPMNITTLLATPPTQNQSQSQSQTKAKSPSNESWVWILTPQQLQPVPIFHPMERTAITIDDLALPTITARISEFLRQHSIPANYSNSSSRVDCMTDGLLKFVIQLWRSPETSRGVVIEVQRRQGSCMAMQEMRRDLLDAVHTDAATAPKARSSRSTCGFVQDLLDRTKLPPPPSNLPSSLAALELSKRLIETDRLDAQRLGLESLCSMTDPRQLLLRDADDVGRTLLTDPSWQALLRQYFLHTKINKNLEDQQVYPGDSRVNLAYEQGECFGALHFLALKVITQSTESMAASCSDQSPNAFVLDLNNSFWGSVLESMHYNLTVPSSRPLEAAWSIRCLRYLQSMEPNLIYLVPNKGGLYECLVQAHDYGKQYHQSLQQETEQWMNVLGFAY